LQRKDELSGTLHRLRAALREEQGRIDESLLEAKRALELELRTFGPQHHRVALAYRELGRAYYLNSSYPQALASYQR
jgi:tetratricopeptide (TPR) repeat protein